MLKILWVSMILWVLTTSFVRMKFRLLTGVLSCNIFTLTLRNNFVQAVPCSRRAVMKVARLGSVFLGKYTGCYNPAL